MFLVVHGHATITVLYQTATSLLVKFQLSVYSFAMALHLVPFLPGIGGKNLYT